MALSFKKLFPRHYKYGGQEVQVRHLEAWMNDYISQIGSSIYALQTDLDAVSTVDLAQTTFSGGELTITKVTEDGLTTTNLSLFINILASVTAATEYAEMDSTSGTFSINAASTPFATFNVVGSLVQAANGADSSRLTIEPTASSFYVTNTTNFGALRLTATTAKLGVENNVNTYLTAAEFNTTYINMVTPGAMRFNGVAPTAGQYLKVTTGSLIPQWAYITDSYNLTLVNGVATQALGAINASSKGFVTRTATNASTGIGELMITFNIGVGFTVTALNAVAATEVGDQSSVTVTLVY